MKSKEIKKSRKLCSPAAYILILLFSCVIIFFFTYHNWEEGKGLDLHKDSKSLTKPKVVYQKRVADKAAQPYLIPPHLIESISAGLKVAKGVLGGDPSDDLATLEAEIKRDKAKILEDVIEEETAVVDVLNEEKKSMMDTKAGLAGSSGSNDDVIHILFSTDCSTYQDWQSLLVFHSAYAVGQKGEITR